MLICDKGLKGQSSGERGLPLKIYRSILFFHVGGKIDLSLCKSLWKHNDSLSRFLPLKPYPHSGLFRIKSKNDLMILTEPYSPDHSSISVCSMAFTTASGSTVFARSKALARM